MLIPEGFRAAYTVQNVICRSGNNIYSCGAGQGITVYGNLTDARVEMFGAWFAAE